jgi:hypothetical protein
MLWHSRSPARCVGFVLAVSLSVADALVAQTAAPAVYHWEPVPGSRKKELYLAGHRIGIYDPEKDSYQRVNTDGTLSGPVRPPWKQPAPSTGTAKADKPATPPEPAPPKAEVSRIPAEEKGAADFTTTLPSWTGYAIGGCVTLLVTILGLVMQLRRH